MCVNFVINKSKNWKEIQRKDKNAIPFLALIDLKFDESRGDQQA